MKLIKTSLSFSFRAKNVICKSQLQIYGGIYIYSISRFVIQRMDVCNYPYRKSINDSVQFPAILRMQLQL